LQGNDAAQPANQRPAQCNTLPAPIKRRATKILPRSFKARNQTRRGGGRSLNASVLKKSKNLRRSRRQSKAVLRMEGRKQRDFIRAKNRNILETQQRQENHWRISPIKTGNAGIDGDKTQRSSAAKRNCE